MQVLKLRRARVLEVGSPAAAEQPLRIVLIDEDGSESAARDAIAQVTLVGCVQEGDEVIVNTQARDLGLGSGGFDIVHVNLTRGLRGEGRPGAHVMKLNYTSLQHAVDPVEAAELTGDVHECPVAVIALHGQLAPVAWAFARARPNARLGYVQTAGGALPGGHSHVVHHLRGAGMLAGHITAGAAFGGESEAISTIGALQHGLGELGWDAAVCGPGPGLVGSSSALGHGGMAALDSAHAALALGCPTVVVVRMSSGDPRARHRGISHHSLTVLDLLLAPVVVALPPGVRPPGGEAPPGVRPPGGEAPTRASAAMNGARDGGGGVRRARPSRLARHDWRAEAIDLPGYAASGLPAETMGRPMSADPLFFVAALAGGAATAGLVAHDEAGAPAGAAAVAPPGQLPAPDETAAPSA